LLLVLIKLGGIMKPLRKQGIIIFSILALVLAACGGSTTEETAEETTPEVVETLDSPAVTTASSVETGVGVTSEPCPEEIGGVPTGADPSKGCIYLGMLNDYTGPYAAVAPALETAQRGFWLWANSTGGIGDYSVAIIEGADTSFNPQKHLEQYNAQRDQVAALAMSLGTNQTLFILDEMDKDNMVAAPMSWYSGWSYKSLDRGLVVEFGAAYCADGMNALDWAIASLPVDIKTIGIMGFAGDYGGDWAQGIKYAAERNGITVAWEYLPPTLEFDVAQAVGLMVTQPVDAYFPAVGPGEMAQVAGGAFQQGLTPIAMMAAPSYNDAFVQEGFPLKPLFESGSMYSMAWVAPYEADTAAHATMRATFAQMGIESASSFLVAGWSSQYHLKGVLEAAVKGGDLTRAGIRRAAANVYVESDGMMQTRELGQNRADNDSYINIPDGSIGSGARLLAPSYVGPSAESYDWTSGPCA
jgi:ABC-type branched-subunit amino acid transport system substrate-binding protein